MDINTNLAATAIIGVDAADNELNELTSENNLISQQLKLPLSTNQVTINVNNFGNTLSNVFLFAQIIDGPGCYTIKDWIKKLVPVNNSYCPCHFEFVWPNDVSLCLRGKFLY